MGQMVIFFSLASKIAFKKETICNLLCVKLIFNLFYKLNNISNTGHVTGLAS